VIALLALDGHQLILLGKLPKLMQIFKARRLPLRTALIVPFVVQVAGVAGLVSYLSFLSGQRAVNDLATQLRSEVSARIDGEMRKYLNSP